MRFPRLDALACCAVTVPVLLFAATDAVAQARSAGAMTQAATAFLASLTPEQGAKAVTSAKGFEAGVWVVAETRFARRSGWRMTVMSTP